MAAYRWVYDSHHLQADYQEPGSALEPYARQSSMGYLYLFTSSTSEIINTTEDESVTSAAWSAR